MKIHPIFSVVIVLWLIAISGCNGSEPLVGNQSPGNPATNLRQAALNPGGGWANFGSNDDHTRRGTWGPHSNIASASISLGGIPGDAHAVFGEPMTQGNPGSQDTVWVVDKAGNVHKIYWTSQWAMSKITYSPWQNVSQNCASTPVLDRNGVLHYVAFTSVQNPTPSFLKNFNTLTGTFGLDYALGSADSHTVSPMAAFIPSGVYSPLIYVQGGDGFLAIPTEDNRYETLAHGVHGVNCAGLAPINPNGMPCAMSTFSASGGSCNVGFFRLRQTYPDPGYEEPEPRYVYSGPLYGGSFPTNTITMIPDLSYSWAGDCVIVGAQQMYVLKITPNPPPEPPIPLVIGTSVGPPATDAFISNAAIHSNINAYPFYVYVLRNIWAGGYPMTPDAPCICLDVYYLASHDGPFTLIWSSTPHTYRAPTYSSPAVDAAGRAYISTVTTHTIQTPQGAPRTVANTELMVFDPIQQPTVHNPIYSLQLTGGDTPDTYPEIQSSPVIGADGRVYAATKDGVLYAIWEQP
jgi:outer membrane protein assembly factor BamB